MLLIRICTQLDPLSLNTACFVMNESETFYVISKINFSGLFAYKKRKDITLLLFGVVYAWYTVPNNYSGYLSNKLYYLKLMADDIPVLIITFLFAVCISNIYQNFS